MANFDNILAGIHSGQNVETKDMDNENKPIEITSKRAFQLPDGFDTIIGYVGDVNSQVITFKVPRSHENHDLSLCGKKTIKWKNLTSGLEGQNELTTVDVSATTMTLTWSLQPEIFTKAGFIEISISIYDISTNGRIAFSWNTPTFSRLEVGSGNTGVATVINGYRAPAKNEILYVDTETRQIVMPKDYNPVFANLGDVNTSLVFFQIPAWVKGMYLLENSTDIKINVAMNDEVKSCPIPITDRFAENENDISHNSLVNLVWKPTPDITNNGHGYVGNITISLSIFKQIEKDGEVDTVKYWMSSQFNKLAIGDTVAVSANSDFGTQGKQTVVDGNQWNNHIMTHVVGGIIKLREHNEAENSPYGDPAAKKKVESIHDNELITYFAQQDGQPTFKGLMLGAENKNYGEEEEGTLPENAICFPMIGNLKLHNLYLSGESQAMLKGFYWKTIDSTNNIITLSTEQDPSVESDDFDINNFGLEVGDTISINIGNKVHNNCATITEFISSNQIKLSSLLGSIQQELNSAVARDEIVDCAVFFAEKPYAGKVFLGYYNFAFGQNNNALGYGSAVFGKDNKAIGDGSFVGGIENSALYGSAVFGLKNQINMLSFAFGEDNETKAKWSIAGGYQSVAESLASIAIGYQANASSLYAIALGYKVKAGFYSVAIGKEAKTSNLYEVALGSGFIDSCGSGSEYNIAIGKGRIEPKPQPNSEPIKHAIALSEATVRANYGFGAGEGIEVSTNHMAAFGKYNENLSTSLFEIGDGTNTTKHNAFEVRKTEEKYSVRVGNTLLTEDEISKLKDLLASIEFPGGNA